MFKTVVTAVIFGAATSGAAVAQSSLDTNVPRSNYIATMDGEFRKMDADKNGQVTRAEVESFDRGSAVANARARGRRPSTSSTPTAMGSSTRPNSTA